MNTNFFVDCRWYTTPCKTVLNADEFVVEFFTDKHSIVTKVSDKCYFLSIDNITLSDIKCEELIAIDRETEVRVKRKPITTDIDMKEMFTEERATAKSLLNSVYGITSERETATVHTYEIRVFKNSVFICSCTFSLESFAEFTFSIMEKNAIDFPKPCFKVIELFKDGKLVKMSSIYFGKIVLEVKNG